MRSVYRVLVGKPEGETTRKTNIDGRITLGRNLEKQKGGIVWINLA
jgi:hypothetical protein